MTAVTPMDKTEDAALASHDTDDSKENVERILKGRAASYRLFSRIFLSPLSESDLEELSARNFSALASDLKDSQLLAEGFNDMGRALKRRNSGTRQQLATDYTMCFDGIEAADGLVAVPYASVFLGEEALLNQEPRNEVYRIFRAESVKPKDTLRLPEDHLSFELDFLAILSERSAEAQRTDDVSEALRNLAVSQSFIEDHILSWYDLFAERANLFLKTRFYCGALKACRAYLDLDLQVIAGLQEMLTDD